MILRAKKTCTYYLNSIIDKVKQTNDTRLKPDIRFRYSYSYLD